MGQLLEIIYGILFQPSSAFRDIKEQQPLGQSALVLLAVTLLTAWTGYFALWAKSVFVLVSIFITVFMWFFGTAVAHLTAELCGGNGRAKSLLAAYGYVQVPRIFSVPLFVIASFFPKTVMAGILTLTGLIILGWELILRIIAIREVYSFSTGRAVFVLFAPYLVLILCGVGLGVVLATAVFQIISHMGPELFPPFMQ